MFDRLRAHAALYPLLVTLAGVLIFGWPAVPIMLTYWLEAMTPVLVAAIGIARNWASASDAEREAYLRARRGEQENHVPVEEKLRRGIAERGAARSGGFVARQYVTFRLAFGLFMLFAVIGIGSAVSSGVPSGGAIDLLAAVGGPLGLVGLLVAFAVGLARGLGEVVRIPRDTLPDVAAAERRFWPMLLATFASVWLGGFLSFLGSFGLVAIMLVVSLLLTRLADRRVAGIADPVAARQASFAAGSLPASASLVIDPTAPAPAAGSRVSAGCAITGIGCVLVSILLFLATFALAGVASGDPIFLLIPALIGASVAVPLIRAVRPILAARRDQTALRHGVPAGVWMIDVAGDRLTVSGPGGEASIALGDRTSRLVGHPFGAPSPDLAGVAAGRVPLDHLDLVDEAGKIIVAAIPLTAAGRTADGSSRVAYELLEPFVFRS